MEELKNFYKKIRIIQPRNRVVTKNTPRDRRRPVRRPSAMQMNADDRALIRRRSQTGGSPDGEAFPVNRVRNTPGLLKEKNPPGGNLLHWPVMAGVISDSPGHPPSAVDRDSQGIGYRTKIGRLIQSRLMGSLPRWPISMTGTDILIEHGHGVFQPSRPSLQGVVRSGDDGSEGGL